MWNSKPAVSDIFSSALQIELVSLTQGWSSFIDIYTRNNIRIYNLLSEP